MRIDESTLVVVDTETTGGHTRAHRIIEIGAVKLQAGQIVDRFDTLVNPETIIPRSISRLTGITNDLVVDAPLAEEVLPGFLEFLGDGVLVAHNLNFDRSILNRELEWAGHSRMRNEELCTLRLARRLLRALPSRSLASLKKHYGVQVPVSHRALPDAEATTVILKILLDRLRNEFGIEELDEVLAFQNKRYDATQPIAANVKRIRNEVLPNIPATPGVYFHKDSLGTILYVGKAKSLQDRVRSYFTAVDNHPPRIRRLVKSVATVEWEETRTELGALVRELQLIRELQPRYNVALKSGRQRPLIKVDRTTGEASAAYQFTAQKKYRFYGPFRNRDEADSLLVGLREFVPAGSADPVTTFLGSDGFPTLDFIEDRMQAESEAMNFEKAAVYRDVHRSISHLVDRFGVVAPDLEALTGVLVEGGDSVDAYMLHYGLILDTDSLDQTPPENLATRIRKHCANAVSMKMPRLESGDLDRIQIVLRRMQTASDNMRWLSASDVVLDPDLVDQALA